MSEAKGNPFKGVRASALDIGAKLAAMTDTVEELPWGEHAHWSIAVEEEKEPACMLTVASASTKEVPEGATTRDEFYSLAQDALSWVGDARKGAINRQVHQEFMDAIADSGVECRYYLAFATLYDGWVNYLNLTAFVPVSEDKALIVSHSIRADDLIESVSNYIERELDAQPDN